MGSAALRCPPGSHGAWPPERPLVPETLNDAQNLYPLWSTLCARVGQAAILPTAG